MGCEGLRVTKKNKQTNNDFHVENNAAVPSFICLFPHFPKGLFLSLSLYPHLDSTRIVSLSCWRPAPGPA